MILNTKTLEKLRILINEETEYRSGPKLVEFFNQLGSKDTYSYQGGFPSRWLYTDQKLAEINGKPELDDCIRNLFAPINFIGKMKELASFIKDFNQYLAFDGWQVIQNGKEITFQKNDHIDVLYSKDELTEDMFLTSEFEDIPINKLGIDSTVVTILENRINEIKKCLQTKSSLSVVFLCGSTLEGILLGFALKYPSEYNQSNSAPKNKDGSIKKFPFWTLANFIDVTYENGFIKEDVKKFSHSLRDFRNYIHPYEQMASGFDPDEHTSKICFQVLKTAIFQLSNSK